MRGRNTLHSDAMEKWVDEAEQWLQKNFGTNLLFVAALNPSAPEVTLTVYKRLAVTGVRPQNVGPGKMVFSVTEPAKYFVSRATVTKIILIAG